MKFYNLLFKRNKNINKKILIEIFNLFIFLIFIFKIEFYKTNINSRFKYQFYNLYSLTKYLNLNIIEKNNNDSIKFFKLNSIKYVFSFKFKLIKFEYNIGFYDINYNLVSPSDLSLYNKLHIICYFEVINKNIKLYSIPNIYKNKYFQCIEFFNINEKVKLGFKIYKNEKQIEFSSINIFLINRQFFNKNDQYIQDWFFEPFIINKKYISLSRDFKDISKNQTLKFIKSFSLYPHLTLRRNANIYYEKWYFRNIFNNYFCFCLGENCLKFKNSQYCKYYFYLNIIHKNRNIYKKTDYLFIDFILEELSSDDVYPVFESMATKNMSVHYMTENLEIYNKYCFEKNKCLTVIHVSKENYTMDGDFLENYLTLFLKLKAVISARATPFNFATNIFYNLEYITYIGVGHGISFFKYFLYNAEHTYGIKRNDKIVLPPSDKLIYPAKKYGWKEDNIIKMNLPRWEKYDKHVVIENKDNLENYSIFIMFTWRDLKYKKLISPYYFENIITLINNDKLYQELMKKNITIYFSLHPLLNKYILAIKMKFENNRYIKFINANNISECLLKVDLVVSDFSSIIFDLIYRRKPFVIFIPDANDPNIKDIYTKDYYELIESMKNGTIEFMNKYFELNEAINKIIYYINNNFNLEKKMKIFYDSFQLKKGNYIKKLVKYLNNL